MKHALILLSLLFSVIAQAQDTPIVKEKQKTGRFQIGINFSPDMCYRTLHKRSGDFRDYYQNHEALNQDQTLKLGYTGGLSCGYDFNHWLGLELGLQFTNFGYQSKLLTLDYPASFYPWLGFVVDREVVAASVGRYTESYYTLGIPLKFNFKIGSKRLRFITAAGVSTNFLLKHTLNSYQRFENDYVLRTSIQTQMNNSISVEFVAMASAGIDYQISSHFHFRAEPNFRYELTSYSAMSVPAHYWSLGLGLGGYYTF